VQGVNVIQSDGTIKSNQTIHWAEGIIRRVSTSETLPSSARILVEGDSLLIVPAFIDGLNHSGLPDAEDPSSYGTPDRPSDPTYDRAGIQPHKLPESEFDVSHSSVAAHQSAGFGAINSSRPGRMMPGQSSLFFTQAEETFSGFESPLYESALGFVFQFEGAGGRAYPATDMAIMARFKQLLYDAEALQQHINYVEGPGAEQMETPQRDAVLESLFPLLDGEKPLMASVESPEDAERVLMLADEFDFPVIFATHADLSPIATKLVQSATPVLFRFEKPEAPDWIQKETEETESGENTANESVAADNADDAATDESNSASEQEPQEELSEEEQAFRARQASAWEAKKGALRSMLDAGLMIGVQGYNGNDKDFFEALRFYHEEGEVSSQELLNILSSNTAMILGIERLGTLTEGSLANMIVINGQDWLSEDATRLFTVSNGHVITIDND
jgi:imidazolonepropionase-like amidohydrolase